MIRLAIDILRSVADVASVSQMSMPPPNPGRLAPSANARLGSAVPRPRVKVALKPGRSPMDWAALRASGTNLRGIDSPGPIRVTRDELAKHKSRDDIWTALRGRVYNLTPYMEYHPGGEKELLRVAGRDGTRLFELTHAWVNYEHMLDKCFVGVLV